MVWNTPRKRFFAALLLFVLWVAALAALAVVSAYRPAARSAPPGQISSISRRTTEAGASTMRSSGPPWSSELELGTTRWGSAKVL